MAAAGIAGIARTLEAVEIRPQSGALLGKVVRQPGGLLTAEQLDQLEGAAPSLPAVWQELLAAYKALRSTRVEVGSLQCKRLIYRYRPQLRRRGLLVLHYVDPYTGDITDTRIILEPEQGSRDLSRSGIRLDPSVLTAAVQDFYRGRAAEDLTARSGNQHNGTGH